MPLNQTSSAKENPIFAISETGEVRNQQKINQHPRINPIPHMRIANSISKRTAEQKEAILEQKKQAGAKTKKGTNSLAVLRYQCLQ